MSNIHLPYLDAIQQIPGLTPGEKFKKLHQISSELAEKSQESITSELQSVPQGLIPLVKILVAEKLGKTSDLIDGLKSEDQLVVNQTLKSKFLFCKSHPLLNPNDFGTKIFPYVSLRTRKKIIRKLANCLFHHQLRAESFFLTLVKLYGVDHTLPLLLSCSQDFIFEQVLKHKIVLSPKTLDILLRRHPDLVMKYLQLGNKDNSMDHEISLQKYAEFLPKLIKNYPQIFVAVYELIPEQNLSLGQNRTQHFLKSVINKLIESPRIFLKLLNLKIVTAKLSISEFEQMFKNLFPKDLDEFNLDEVISFLEFYPQGQKWDLLKITFLDTYGKELLGDIERTKSEELMNLLPVAEREKHARILFEKFGKRKIYWGPDWRMYLPTEECFKIYKDLIAKESDMWLRGEYLGKMIGNCKVYDSQVQLAAFLDYYNSRHKNEQSYVLNRVMAELVNYFNLEKLNQDCWAVLKEIVLGAHVKDELFHTSIHAVEAIFRGALRNVQDWTDKVVDMILEYRIKHVRDRFNFLIDQPQMERTLLEKFITLTPQKYPKDDPVWNDGIKMSLIVNLVESMQDFNVRNSDLHRFALRDYKWIVESINEIYVTDGNIDNSNQRWHLKKLLKKHEPDMYKKIMFGTNLSICPVESGEAFDMLRKNPKEIMDRWQEYLETTIEKSGVGFYRKATQFVRATKWYKDLPIRFVNYSLEHVKKRDCMFVLGILLDGQTFSQMIVPFMPQNDTIDLCSKDSKDDYNLTASIPLAMILVEPPPSFEAIEPFCEGDYCYLGIKALSNMASRTPPAKVIEFAQQLMKKKIGMKKESVRLSVKNLTIPEVVKFLDETWEKEHHVSLREVIVKEIKKVLKKTSNQEALWGLLKKCIVDLSSENANCLKELVTGLTVSLEKKLIGDYLQVILLKIDEFPSEKSNILGKIFEGIDEKLADHVPEEVWTFVISGLFSRDNAYFKVICQFTVKHYLLPASQERFQNRLKIVMVHLVDDIIAKWDVVHPNRPREIFANSVFRVFVNALLTEAVIRNNSNSKAIVEALANLFWNLKLLPWHETESYLKTQFYFLYLEKTDVKDFGNTCGKNITEIVKIFGSDSILTEIAECLGGLIQIAKNHGYLGTNLSFNGFLEWKLNFIEGLMNEGDYYGSFVAAKLLKIDEVSKYGPRYDDIVKKLKTTSHISVLRNINTFLNQIYNVYTSED